MRALGIGDEPTTKGDEEMTDPMRISAKNLAKLAMPNVCQRCFWTLLRVRFNPPFSVFPSIFRDFDELTKRITYEHFDRTGNAPQWFGEFSDAEAYRIVGRLTYVDENSGATLTGEPDLVLNLPGD